MHIIQVDTRQYMQVNKKITKEYNIKQNNCTGLTDKDINRSVQA